MPSSFKNLVYSISDKLGLNVQINNIDNPRKELEDHYYNPAHTGLKELGLKEHLLTDDVMEEMIKEVIEHKDKIDEKMIMPRVKWKK